MIHEQQAEFLNRWWRIQHHTSVSKSIPDQIVNGLGHGMLWSVGILGWWVVFELTKLGGFS